MTISFDVPSLNLLAPERRNTLTRQQKLLQYFIDKILIPRMWKPSGVRVLFLMFFLLFPMTASSFQIGSDGSFSYMDSDIQPYLSQLIRGVDNQDWVPEPGSILISVLSEAGGLWDEACTTIIKGPPMNMDEISKNDFAIVRSLISSHSETTNYGGPYCSLHHGQPLQLLWVQITSTEVLGYPGKSQTWFNQFYITGFPSEPTQCSASLEGPMSFGVLDGRGPHLAETRINVSCSQESVIALKVNNGTAFLEPESGTQISFVTRVDSNLGESNTECLHDCSVRVIGEMISAPTYPGAYNWSVPVIVEYK